MALRRHGANWLTAALAVLTVVAFAAAGPAVAGGKSGYRLTVIRAPGRNVPCRGRVEVDAINDSGEMVGSAGCQYQSLLIIDHGRSSLIRLPSGRFKDDGGASVASNGLVAATTANYQNPFYSFTSWLRYPDGKLRRLADPAAYRASTQVFAVNRHGTAVGRFPTTGRGHPDSPFIYRTHGPRKGFTTFHLAIPGATDVVLSGINDRGDLCGDFLDKNNVHRGFVRHNGHTRVVSAPGASEEKYKGTFLEAIANNGDLAASVNPALHPAQTLTLVHARGGWTTLSLPHAGTRLYSPADINSAGVAVINYLSDYAHVGSLKATPTS